MTQRVKGYIRKAFLRGWLQSKDEAPAKQITRKEGTAHAKALG